jgi:protoporphyrin/coproporphyrin ferrochelatase
VASPAIDSVLLVGFGGPTGPDEVRPFLDNVLRGRLVPRERYEEVVRHYDHLGGRSPYNELTLRQAGSLRAALARDRVTIPIEVGMRNWTPYVDDALRTLAEAGGRRTLAFILAAHRSEASWERYQVTVRAAQSKLDGRAPEIVYPEPWHEHPLFISAVVARVRDALARLDINDRADAHLIFTAHSIAVAMAAASGYVEQLTQSSRLAAHSLGTKTWQLAYQSRSGSPREPWLEPDVAEAIRNLNSRAAVVMPLGFLCDHVEVLYDLDIELAKVARECEIRMERAATVGDHPDFIAMMASIVRSHL